VAAFALIAAGVAPARAVARDAGATLTAIRAERLARRIESVLAKDSGRTAKAIVHDEAGNVLVIRDATYGTWDLPGGHLHEGESLNQGLHREVKEETGLEISGESWNRNVNQGRTEVFDTQVFGVKPRVTLSDEHTAFKWVEPQEAEKLAAFWLQDTSGNVPGSSRASFYPETGPTGVPATQNALNAKERVRSDAEKQIGRAVNRVVTLAEAGVLAKQPADDFWPFAAAAFFGAVMAAYGQSAKALAVIERGADHGETVTEAEERAHAEQRAELLKDFPKRIRERLELELKRGEELGETESELHLRITSEGERILEGEGRVVAETEAQAIAGSATLRALKRAGFETCFWVTVGDERVRDSHTHNESVGAVKLGDKFPNGCRFPGDPLAPLAETINCRCWLVGANREVIGASDTGQRRAKPGGEFGANGEWYEGGKWIATQEDRAKQAPAPVHELSPEEKERREQLRLANEKQAAHVKAWTEARRTELKPVLDVLKQDLKDMWGNPLTEQGFQPNQFLLSLHQQLLGGNLSPRQAEFATKEVLGRRTKKNAEEWDALHQKISEDFEPGHPTYEATKPQ